MTAMTRKATPRSRSESERLRAAGETINLCVWLVAAVVMVFSAVTGARLLAANGVDWRLGLAGGLAVDAALVVALVGDRQLHRHNEHAGWGTVLRWTTAAMTLVLNCGKSAADGRYGAALLHAIFPVLLVVLTEAAQSYQLAFARAILAARDTAVSGKVRKAAGTGTRAGTDSVGTGPETTPGTHLPQPSGRTTDTDGELWSRAVQLVTDFHRTHGRDPKLGEFHTALRMSRNAASPLRNAVLAAVAEHGEYATQHPPSTRGGTDGQVIPLHHDDPSTELQAASKGRE